MKAKVWHERFLRSYHVLTPRFNIGNLFPPTACPESDSALQQRVGTRPLGGSHALYTCYVPSAPHGDHHTLCSHLPQHTTVCTTVQVTVSLFPLETEPCAGAPAAAEDLGPCHLLLPEHSEIRPSSPHCLPRTDAPQTHESRGRDRVQCVLEILLWAELCPPPEIFRLTPGTCECDRIWKQSAC